MEDLFTQFLAGSKADLVSSNDGDSLNTRVPEKLKDDESNLPPQKKSIRPRQKSGAFSRQSSSKRPRRKTGSFKPVVTDKRQSIISNDSGFDTFVDEKNLKTPEKKASRPKKKSMINKLQGYYPNFKVAMSPDVLNSPRTTRSGSKRAPASTLSKKSKSRTKSMTETVTVKKNLFKTSGEKSVKSRSSLSSDGIRSLTPEGQRERNSILLSSNVKSLQSRTTTSTNEDFQATQTSLSFDNCLGDDEVSTSPKSNVVDTVDSSVVFSPKEDNNTTFIGDIASFKDSPAPDPNSESSPASFLNESPQTEASQSEAKSRKRKKETALTKTVENVEEHYEYVHDGKERIVEPKTNKNSTPMRRRSKRRCWKPLRYWRGERVVYSKNLARDIQIKGALKTMHISSPKDPVLKKTRSRALGFQRSKSRRTSCKIPDYLNIEKVSNGVVEYVDPDTEERKEVVFREKVYEKRNWQKTKVVSDESSKQVVKEYPPLTLTKSEVKKAWIEILPETSNETVSTGKMKIPPRSFKMMEDSGGTVSYFIIERCQKNSIVFRLNDGDHIVEEEMSITIPKDTVYGFENMSKDEDAIIHYAIEQIDEESVSE